MGRTISSEIKDHLGKQTTTLAICWKLVRKDGTVMGYTSHDKDIEYGGVTYYPAECAEVSSLEQTADAEPDNMEISVAFGEGITKYDVYKGLYDNASLYVFMINYEDTGMGIIKIVSGNIGNITAEEYGGKFEFFSLSDRLKTTTGNIYDYRCNARLGDERCGVNLTSWTTTGTVTSVIDRGIFTDSSNTYEDNYYNYGVVTFTSGNNDGWTREVKTFESCTFYLFSELPYSIEIGDTFTIVKGCDGFHDTCKGTFDNFVNFRGQPHIPGRDEVIKYPDAH